MGNSLGYCILSESHNEISKRLFKKSSKNSSMQTRPKIAANQMVYIWTCQALISSYDLLQQQLVYYRYGV